MTPDRRSIEEESVIRVDRDDRPIGIAAKRVCHDGSGLLHRAFSVHLVDPQGRVLVQRRSPEKRLWPGYWSNSCCSHPRPGETVEAAVRRRVEEELGITVETLEYLYKFEYHATYGAIGAEWEVCWVYLGGTADRPQPDPTELDAWDWWSPEHITRRLVAEGEGTFTPWFCQEWRELEWAFPQRLAAYGAVAAAS